MVSVWEGVSCSGGFDSEDIVCGNLFSAIHAAAAFLHFPVNTGRSVIPVRKQASSTQNAGFAPRSSAGANRPPAAPASKNVHTALNPCRLRRVWTARRQTEMGSSASASVCTDRIGICSCKYVLGSPARMQIGLPLCASCISACSGPAASMTSVLVCEASCLI